MSKIQLTLTDGTTRTVSILDEAVVRCKIPGDGSDNFLPIRKLEERQAKRTPDDREYKVWVFEVGPMESLDSVREFYSYYMKNPVVEETEIPDDEH